MKGRKSDQVYTIDVLDALYQIKEAWSLVKQQCVANCFRHVGFVTQNDDAGEKRLRVRLLRPVTVRRVMSQTTSPTSLTG